MPTFYYKATDKNGKLITGILTASSEKEAEILLRDKKLKILVIKDQEKKFSSFSPFAKFSLKEKSTLCRYLSLMINAGIPLNEAFELISNSTKNKTVKQMLEDVSFSVTQGKSLHASFSKYPQYFDDVFLVMVKTGEAAGSLGKSFDYLAKQYQQEGRLKQKVVGALAYPLIIVALMIAVGVLILTFVLPKLAKVFLRLKIDIPFFTRFLFQFSLFLEKNMIPAFSLFLIFAFFVFVFFKTKLGKSLIYSFLNHLPFFERVILEYNLVRFNQNLSALLQAGVSITDSLELAVNSLTFVKKEELAKIFSQKLTQGLPLTTAFSEAKIFPPLMVQMVKVGEKTGSLEKILVDLSLFYQEEVENSLKNFITILEPILLILVGLGVGVMVLSVITPIYSLINKLQAVR